MYRATQEYNMMYSSTTAGVATMFRHVDANLPSHHHQLEDDRFDVDGVACHCNAAVHIVNIIRQRPVAARLAGACAPAAGALLPGPMMTIVTMMTMMWLRSCRVFVHVACSCLHSAIA